MAITNLAQFNADLNAEVAQISKKLNTIVRVVSMQVLAGVVQETRVRTGRARGNWQVTNGSPSEIVDVDTLDPNGGNTINKGSQTISQAKTFGQVWIVNNLPYIEFLETLDQMAELTASRVKSQFEGGE